jgi:hypothetical protein
MLARMCVTRALSREGVPHCGLPFGRIVLSLGELGDVGRCLAQGALARCRRAGGSPRGRDQPPIDVVALLVGGAAGPCKRRPLTARYARAVGTDPRGCGHRRSSLRSCNFRLDLRIPGKVTSTCGQSKPTRTRSAQPVVSGPLVEGRSSLDSSQVHRDGAIRSRVSAAIVALRGIAFQSPVLIRAPVALLNCRHWEQGSSA